MGRQARRKRLEREARGQQVPGEPVRKPRMSAVVKGAILLGLGATAWWAWARFRSRPLDTEPYGHLRVVREASGGPTLYLIPMEHYYASQTETGPEKNAEQLPTLAPIQMEVYRILERLHAHGDVDLIFGEGLYGEFRFDYHKHGWEEADYRAHQEKAGDDDFLVTFFRANPKEIGYTVLELFHPETSFFRGLSKPRSMRRDFGFLREHSAHWQS